MDRPHGIGIGPVGVVYIGDTNNRRFGGCGAMRSEVRSPRRKYPLKEGEFRYFVL